MRGTAVAPFSSLATTALPSLALLLVTVVLYVWMAPRGFDFTDESYYLLSYRYWADLVGTVTFFGALVEGPYRAMGESLTAIRLLSLVLLLGGGAFLMDSVLRVGGGDRRSTWVMAAVGMAGGLTYYWPLTTLRAPSYNLLALVTMLVATGLLLRIAPAPAKRGRLAMLGYGLAIGACVLAKPPSAVLAVACHVPLLLLIARDRGVAETLRLGGLATLGSIVVLALLQLAHPGWLGALREGVRIANLMGSHGLLRSTRTLLWEVWPILPGALVVGVLATAVTVVATWQLRASPWRLSLWIVLVCVGCTAGMTLAPAHLWWPFAILGVVLLWLAELVARPARWPWVSGSDLVDAAAMATLCALPIAVSFGTNMPVLEHTRMAAVFLVTAIAARLFRLWRDRKVLAPALALCLAALCVPALLVQVRAATDVRATYRQLVPLAEQHTPLRLGRHAETLWVDPVTAASITSMLGLAHAAGLRGQHPMLDLSGDRAGLVHILGGRPLGVAWLLGGYPGSEAVAKRVVGLVPAAELRDAWLLASDDHPRRIDGWRQLLAERIGADSHALVGSVEVRMGYGWGKDSRDPVQIQLWKPNTANSPTVR